MAGIADILQKVATKSDSAANKLNAVEDVMLKLNASLVEPKQEVQPLPQQPVAQPISKPAFRSAPPQNLYRSLVPPQSFIAPQAPQKQVVPSKSNFSLSQMFLLNDLQHALPIGLSEAIATAETGHIKDWNKRASVVSPAGAVGLMQFMPATGKRYGLDANELRNPMKSMDAAGNYLHDLMGMFDDPVLAAAAYNAGEGAVKIYRGIPPYQETQKYTKKVKAFLDRANLASLLGS